MAARSRWSALGGITLMTRTPSCTTLRTFQPGGKVKLILLAGSVKLAGQRLARPAGQGRE
jgi:hypothetical protein